MSDSLMFHEIQGTEVEAIMPTIGNGFTRSFYFEREGQSIRLTLFADTREALMINEETDEVIPLRDANADMMSEIHKLKEDAQSHDSDIELLNETIRGWKQAVEERDGELNTLGMEHSCALTREKDLATELQDHKIQANELNREINGLLSEIDIYKLNAEKAAGYTHRATILLDEEE